MNIKLVHIKVVKKIWVILMKTLLLLFLYSTFIYFHFNFNFKNFYIGDEVKMYLILIDTLKLN